MRSLNYVLVTLCLATIARPNTVASDSSKKVDDTEVIAEVIQELIDKTRSGLEEAKKKAGDITTSLQTNVLEVIYEGKEKLFLLKEDVKAKFDVDQTHTDCAIELLKELEAFESAIKAKLEECALNVFEYSESYRQKIKDDVAEYESSMQILQVTDRCFGGENGSRRCYQDQINEYRKMNEAISTAFDDIYNDAKENAIEILSDLLDCNKAVLKDAKKKQQSLKEKAYTCTELNSSTP